MRRVSIQCARVGICFCLAGLLPACGDDSDPSTPGSGGETGSGSQNATGGVGGQTSTGGTGNVTATGGSSGTTQPAQPFVPNGVTVEYVGEGPSGGLEIIAFTLVQEAGSLSEPAWYVALQHNGTDPVCIVDVPAGFYDAAGNELATTIGTGSLSSPMYETFGSPAPCLGPGDIGMGEITLGLESLDVSQVAKIKHGFAGNIDPDAVRLTGVAVQNTQVQAAYTDSVRVTGTVVNNGSATIYDPTVDVYAVDATGRPYGTMMDIELISIPPGGSWDFETLAFEGQLDDYEVFVEYDDA